MTTFTCGHCPARLAWVATGTGLMTIDAEPSRDGNLLVRDATVVDVLGPKRARAARRQGTQLHTNHRWTCPASLDPLAIGRPPMMPALLGTQGSSASSSPLSK